MTARKPPAPPKGKPAPVAKKAAKPETATRKNRRHDWEAIERDYRTGQFTLQELEAKHGPGFADISRRAKRDAWTKDLRQAVKQATSAAVLAETTKGIAKAITKNTAETTKNVVLAAAEVNKQIILGHRDDLSRMRQLALSLMDEVAASRVTPDQFALLTEILAGENADSIDMKAARGLVERMTDRSERVRDAKALTEIFERVRKGEREAFAIGDGEGGDEGGKDGATAVSKYDLSDDEIMAEIKQIKAARAKAVAA